MVTATGSGNANGERILRTLLAHTSALPSRRACRPYPIPIPPFSHFQGLRSTHFWRRDVDPACSQDRLSTSHGNPHLLTAGLRNASGCYYCMSTVDDSLAQVHWQQGLTCYGHNSLQCPFDNWRYILARLF
jgi:hypothetical protein